jgi:hypothetical protein
MEIVDNGNSRHERASAVALQHGWGGVMVYLLNGKPTWGYDEFVTDALPDPSWEGGRWAKLLYDENGKMHAVCYEVIPTETQAKEERAYLVVTLPVDSGYKLPYWQMIRDEERTPSDALAWVMADPRN